MKRELISLSERSDVTKLATIRNLLLNVLDTAKINKTIESSVLICFSELYTNCIEHSLAKNIQIGLSLEDHSLVLHIFDDGNSDSAKALNQALKKTPSIDTFDLEKENGRGLAIVQQLCDCIDFNVLDKENQSQKWNNCAKITWNDVTTDLGIKILIVEDDPALRCLYENYLADQYLVRSCENGSAAIKILNEEKIDIIISDINMPIMNGIELRDALVNEKKTELIPFIFLSFEEDPQVIAQARLSGVDDLLKKPCNKESLIAVVERVLTRFNALSQRFNERIDKNISAALRPKLPTEIRYWNLAIDTRNTGTGGGDVVLYFEGKESTHIIILDVIGHDETAKFFSYAYSGYIKGLMLGTDNSLSPDRLLSQLSNIIFEDGLLNQLGLTCCAIELHHSGNIKVACAGHPPPFLISDTRMVELKVSGMLLGLLPDQKYRCRNFVVEQFQRLGIYTDGLLESAETAAERKQLESVIFDELAANHNKNIEDHVSQVLATFDKQTKKHALDDALLILMEPTNNN